MEKWQSGSQGCTAQGWECVLGGRCCVLSLVLGSMGRCRFGVLPGLDHYPGEHSARVQMAPRFCGEVTSTSGACLEWDWKLSSPSPKSWRATPAKSTQTWAWTKGAVACPAIRAVLQDSGPAWDPMSCWCWGVGCTWGPGCPKSSCSAARQSPRCVRGPGWVSACNDRSPGSADRGLHVAGWMLKISSFKSSQLLQEQRRQSFGVHLLLLVKENRIPRVVSWCLLVSSETGSCDWPAFKRKDVSHKYILSIFSPSSFMLKSCD